MAYLMPLFSLARGVAVVSALEAQMRSWCYALACDSTQETRELQSTWFRRYAWRPHNHALSRCDTREKPQWADPHFGLQHPKHCRARTMKMCSGQQLVHAC